MTEQEIRSRARLLVEAEPTEPEEMRSFCERLTAEHLRRHPAVLLLLDGEPGAGKTTFCQGFRGALGIEDIINSPTFNILNEYEGARGRLRHYDLYRLGTPEELLDLDFLDRWSAPGTGGDSDFTIHAVEWWQRAVSLYPFALPTYLLTISSVLQTDDRRQARLYEMEHL